MRDDGDDFFLVISTLGFSWVGPMILLFSRQMNQHAGSPLKLDTDAEVEIFETLPDLSAKRNSASTPSSDDGRGCYMYLYTRVQLCPRIASRCESVTWWLFAAQIGYTHHIGARRASS